MDFSILLLRHHCIEYKVALRRSVLQTMRITLGTIKAVTFSHGPACQFRPRLSFEYCATTFKNEDNLAAVIVGMHPDCRTGNKPTLEYAICAVEEHVGSELLFTTLEIRKDRKVHAFEIYDHCL